MRQKIDDWLVTCNRCSTNTAFRGTEYQHPEGWWVIREEDDYLDPRLIDLCPACAAKDPQVQDVIRTRAQKEQN